MNVAVFGLGKLGACLAAVIAERSGHHVYAYDVDEKVRSLIANGSSPHIEPGLQELIAANVPGPLHVTPDVDTAVGLTDLALVVVPTPSLADGRFDPSIVARVCADINEQVRRHRKSGYRIVICSTLNPLDMEQTIEPIATFNSDTEVIYSPLFIALGSVIHNLTHPDLVLIGSRSKATADWFWWDFAASYQGHAVGRVWTVSLVEAELTKLALNCMLSTKIAQANMIARVADTLGANPEVVLAAVGADQRIGGKLMAPGAPAGGPCLPRDLVALGALGARQGVELPLVTGTIAANHLEIDYMLRWITSTASTLRVDSVGILGLSYKPGSPVSDDSLAVHLLREADQLGVFWRSRINVHDPLVSCPEDPRITQYVDPQEVIDRSDIVVVATPHPEYEKLTYSPDTTLNPWRMKLNSAGFTR